MTLDNILAVLTALVGWPAFVALVIDVLKYAGIVNDGTAGKWNFGFQLLGFIGVAVLIGYFPQIDLPGWDAQLLNYVNIAAYIFTLIIQILGTKGFHALYKKTPLRALSIRPWDDIPF